MQAGISCATAPPTSTLIIQVAPGGAEIPGGGTGGEAIREGGGDGLPTKGVCHETQSEPVNNVEATPLPSARVGGFQFFKDLKGPFPQIELMPTGSVNRETAPQ